jgi:hypothetical protein
MCLSGSGDQHSGPSTRVIEILVGINILVRPLRFSDLGYSVKVLSGPFCQIRDEECTNWSCCDLVASRGLGINVLIQPYVCGWVDLCRVQKGPVWPSCL